MGRRCGQEVWVGGVGRRCGYAVWVGGVGRRCEQEVWIRGVDRRKGGSSRYASKRGCKYICNDVSKVCK